MTQLDTIGTLNSLVGLSESFGVKLAAEELPSIIDGLDIGLLHEPDFADVYNRMSYRLFVDMDGVLTDWESQYKASGGTPFKEHEDMDVSITDSYNFWYSMPWLAGGEELWSSIKHLNPIVLSSPGSSTFAHEGKQAWVRENLGESVQVILTPNKDEYADSRSILIDDMEYNITPWVEKEGHGILYNGMPSSACRKLFVAVMNG